MSSDYGDDIFTSLRFASLYSLFKFTLLVASTTTTAQPVPEPAVYRQASESVGEGGGAEVSSLLFILIAPKYMQKVDI